MDNDDVVMEEPEVVSALNDDIVLQEPVPEAVSVSPGVVPVPLEPVPPAPDAPVPVPPVPVPQVPVVAPVDVQVAPQAGADIEDYLVYILSSDFSDHLFSKFKTVIDFVSLASINAPIYMATVNEFMRLRLHQKMLNISTMETEQNILWHFRTLEYFGSILRKISVHFDDDELIQDRNLNIGWYLNKYCKKSLEHIELTHACSEIQNNWTEPFNNVHTLKLSFSNLKNLDIWFPNVRYLSLDDSLIFNGFYQNLEHLCITINHENTCAERFIDCFAKHPFLKQITIHVDKLDMSFAFNLNRRLRSIETLHIFCMRDIINLNNMTVNFDSVKELLLDWCCTDPLPEIPLLFKNLETFRLIVENQTCFFQVQEFDQFIRQHGNSLKKLIIEINERLDEDILETINQDLSNTFNIDEITVKLE